MPGYFPNRTRRLRPRGYTKFKSGTFSEWEADNPVLDLSEPGYITDLRTIRIGDGVTAFVDLPDLNLSSVDGVISGMTVPQITPDVWDSFATYVIFNKTSALQASTATPMVSDSHTVSLDSGDSVLFDNNQIGMTITRSGMWSVYATIIATNVDADDKALYSAQARGPEFYIDANGQYQYMVPDLVGTADGGSTPQVTANIYCAVPVGGGTKIMMVHDYGDMSVGSSTDFVISIGLLPVFFTS